MDANGPAQQKGRLKGRPPELNVSRSHAQRACLGGGIALGDLVPVHGIPPSLEVIGAAVLVIEIVSVFPDVVAHEHALAVHDRSVLVRAGLDRELAVLGDGYEHPARTELASAGGVEVGLEGRKSVV